MKKLSKPNTDIRTAIKNSPAYSYQVAAELGMTGQQFATRLQRKLSNDEKQSIYSAIDTLSKQAD